MLMQQASMDRSFVLGLANYTYVYVDHTGHKGATHDHSNIRVDDCKQELTREPIKVDMSTMAGNSRLEVELLCSLQGSIM